METIIPKQNVLTLSNNLTGVGFNATAEGMTIYFYTAVSANGPDIGEGSLQLVISSTTARLRIRSNNAWVVLKSW